MVDRYNHRVSNQGILPEEMRAVCAELKGTDGELDDLKFDVITVCLFSKITSKDFGELKKKKRTVWFSLPPF